MTTLAELNKSFINLVGTIPFYLGAKARLEDKSFSQANPFKNDEAAEEMLWSFMWEEGFVAMGSAIREVRGEAQAAFWKFGDKTECAYIDGHWRAKVFLDELGQLTGKHGGEKPPEPTRTRATKIPAGDTATGMFPFSKVASDYTGAVAYSITRMYTKSGEHRMMFAYCREDGFWQLWDFKCNETPVGLPRISFATEAGVLDEMHKVARGSGCNAKHWHVAGCYDRVFNCTGFRSTKPEFMAKGNGNIQFPMHERYIKRF